MQQIIGHSENIETKAIKLRFTRYLNRFRSANVDVPMCISSSFGQYASNQNGKLNLSARINDSLIERTY